MDELTTRETQELSRLDGLAMQARHYAEGICMNVLQLGRVLAEAKAICPYGKWGEWVRENGGVSERMAQSMMQTYRRFGEKPYVMGLEKSKLFKMLALPEGTEDEFAEENDLKNMSAREIEDAVKEARAEMQKEIEAKDNRIKELENKNKQDEADYLQRLSDQSAQIAERDTTIGQLKDAAQDAINARNEANTAKTQAENDRDETRNLYASLQDEYDDLNGKYLDLQSKNARGDADRSIEEGLTPEAFSAAVGVFLGSVCQVPYMSNDFGVMKADARRSFEKGLRAIEDWAKSARKAMNTVEAVILNAE